MIKKIDTETFFQDKQDRPSCSTCRYSELCHKQVDQWNSAAESFPNACEHCGGAGIANYTENGAPHGEGYWPMDMEEPCTYCIENDKCPRCGEDLSWEGDHGEVVNCKCGLHIDLEESAPLPAVIPYERPYCLFTESVYEEYSHYWRE